MNRGQLAHLVLGLALLAAMPAWADSPAPAGSKRPLPHPDILALPPETPASAETPASPVQTPATPSVAAPVESGESKEIARRDNATTSVVANNENRKIARAKAEGKSGLLADLFPLLAVLVLIAGIVFILKKYMPARRLLAGSDVLQIVARTHVSPKQQLMLVKLGRKMVMIGVSPDRIQTLAVVDDPDQVAALMGEIAAGSPRSMSRAFVETMDDESEAYIELPVNDPTHATRGQLHGLLHKVRTMSGKTEQEAGMKNEE